MGNSKKIILSRVVPILLLLLFLSFIFSFCSAYGVRKLIVFYSPNCHRCIQIKNEVMPDIEKDFKGLIDIEYSDIAKIENYKLLLSLKEKYKSNIEISLPVFYIEGHFLSGKGQVKENLQSLIAKSLRNPVREGHLPPIDLVAHFKGFKPLAISSAGLIDGINPCAFTVIVFFISFLALQGYRKRELVIIGLSFISAVFLTYLLIGIGVFAFLYNLKGFWLVSRIFNISIGIFSILLGILAICDFFKLKRTGSGEGLFLQLPQAVKNQIHSIIGLHFRKQKNAKAQTASRPRIFILLISTLVTGFLVSVLELVCTGQVYLPTITFILKTAPLKLQALGYLLLYNLMFITPLLIIFLFALLGTTSQAFAKFLKQRLALTKIILAILFLGLGLFLVWRA